MTRGVRAASMLGALMLSTMSPIAAARAEVEPTAAQPTLPTQALTITGKDGRAHLFSVEIASTPREQEVGEMFRTAVPANGGMLFVWPRSQDSSMWMENTLVPLDMVFIGQDGTVSSIVENAVPRSLAIIDSGGPVSATLELAGGTTAKLGILVGDRVSSKALDAAPSAASSSGPIDAR